MADEQLLIDIGVDLGNAVTRLNQLGEKVQSLEKGMESGQRKGDGFFGGLLGGAAKIGALVSGVGFATEGIGGLVNIFKSGQEQSDQWNAAMAQTDAVLRSTGGAAGVTKQMVSDLADKLSAGGGGLSTAADDAIASGENLLLTFTNIGKDVFPRATQTMLDMTAAMNGGQVTQEGMKTTAIQLGKALNDPVKGMSALQRVGVTFTADQKEQIQTLQKSGDVMGAQKIILDELAKEFGGSALASTQSFSGQMTVLQEKLANVAQNLGDALMPSLQKVMGFISSDAVMGAVSGLATLLADNLTNALDMIGTAVATVQPYIEPFVTVFQGFFSDMRDGMPLMQNLSETFQALGPKIQNLWTQVQPILAQLAQSLWKWVQDATPVVLQKLGEWGQAIWNWLQNPALPTAIQKLGEWGKAFVDWVGPQIPPLLQKLGELLLALGGWIKDTALPVIMQKLGEWGKAFIDWVGPQIPPLLQKLGELLIAVGGWMKDTALPAIIGKLGEWGKAFIDWVTKDVLPPLPGELLKIGTTIDKWIITVALPNLISKLSEWGKAFVNWITKDVLPNLPGELMKIIAAIAKWTNEQVKNVVSLMIPIGKAIVTGIWQGITQNWAIIDSLLRGRLLEAVAGAMAAIGAHSPAREFIPVGESIVLGIHTGIVSTWNVLTDYIAQGLGIVTDVAVAGVNALTQSMENLTDVSSRTREIWAGLFATMTTGSKSGSTGLANSLASQGGWLGNLAGGMHALNTAVTDGAAAISGSLVNSLSLLGSASNSTARIVHEDLAKPMEPQNPMGIPQGWRDGLNDVFRFMNNAWNPQMDTVMKGGFNDWLEWEGSFLSDFVSAWNSAMDSLHGPPAPGTGGGTGTGTGGGTGTGTGGGGGSGGITGNRGSRPQGSGGGGGSGVSVYVMDPLGTPTRLTNVSVKLQDQVRGQRALPSVVRVSF